MNRVSAPVGSIRGSGQLRYSHPSTGSIGTSYSPHEVSAVAVADLRIPVMVPLYGQSAQKGKVKSPHDLLVMTKLSCASLIYLDSQI